MLQITKFVIAAALTAIIATPMAQASDGRTPSVEEVKKAEEVEGEGEEEIIYFDELKEEVKDYDFDSDEIDEAEARCPCWTEKELEGLASGETKICDVPSEKFAAYLLGTQPKSYRAEEAQVNKTGDECSYKKAGQSVIVKKLDSVQSVACVALINRECLRRKRLSIP